MAWIDTLQRGDVDTDDDGVDLVTFHGAKGLEWPIVHVAGLEDGFVPIAYATTPSQTAEEQRLLYVALTRAQQQLHLSWAKERTFGTQTVKRSGSPLLAPLQEALTSAGTAGAGPVDWRSHLAQTRRAIPGDGAGPDDETRVLDTLRTWRARKARAGQVPPHVIVPDRVLQVIANRRPTAKAQLAAIPGMRPTKLSRYGDEIIDIVSGAT